MDVGDSVSTEGPELINIDTNNGGRLDQIVMSFNHYIKPYSGKDRSKYEITPALSVKQADVVFDKVILYTDEHLRNTQYSIHISSLSDVRSRTTTDIVADYTFYQSCAGSELTVIKSDRDYEWDNVETGKLIYTDELWSLSDFPAELAGQAMLRTSVCDNSNQKLRLSFKIDCDSSCVIVAHPKDKAEEWNCEWLTTDFSRLDRTVPADKEDQQIFFDLYQSVRKYSANETLSLFMNGATDMNSTMYFVVVSSIPLSNSLPSQEPLPVNDLSIDAEGEADVKLQWSETLHAGSYNIYRGTTPFFDAVTPVDNTANTYYIDAGRIGDPSVNYYYAVTAVNIYNESDLSNRVGEFDYQLITTASTDFNEIALPLNEEGLLKASDLLAEIPNCNSVARWNAEFQGYEQYVEFIPPTDFELSPGHPYYVNVTESSVFTQTGPYTSPVFNLIVTSSTDFNEIMLPLDHGYVSTASELLSEIPNCNSVARWNAEFQGYEQYVEFIPPTDFDVSIGYPYYVNMMANTLWPSGTGMPMSRRGHQERAANVSGTVPHLVFGKIDHENNHMHPELSMNAYILNREGERLTEFSPGCSISEDLWFWVQCASFPSNWKPGDIIKIDIHKRGSGDVWRSYQTTLTGGAADQANEEMTPANEEQAIPEIYDMLMNYPNPFNSSTAITYHVPVSGYVKLLIFNATGRQVQTLVNEEQAAGDYQVFWNGSSCSGDALASGIYMMHLITRDQQITKKMLLLR